MFPGCLPCYCSPALSRLDVQLARARPSLPLNALPVHALRQVIIIIVIIYDWTGPVLTICSIVTLGEGDGALGSRVPGR